MRTLLYIIFFVVVMNELNAQPDFPGLMYDHIYFLNNDTGFVSGTYSDGSSFPLGVIWKTTDSGKIWIRKYRNHSPGFKGLKIFDNGIGYSGVKCGLQEGGLIIKTFNFGETWDTVFIFTNIYERPRDVTFIDHDTGWVITSSKIYKTINGGNDWETINVPIVNMWLGRMTFLNSKVGFITGGHDVQNWILSSTIIKTTDGGLNWKVIFDDTLDSYYNETGINGIDFRDDSLGIAVGGSYYYRGFVMRTTDTGETWNLKHIKSESRSYEQNLLDVKFISDSLVIVVGADWAIVRSTNSGKSWTFRNDDYGYSFNNIFFLNNKVGWIVGNGLFKSFDSGENWGNQSFITNISTNNKVLLKTTLSQNYPNPFNPTTTNRYQIPQAGFVSLKIYDILGKEVAILVNEEKSAGSYEVEFSGSSLPSGIYFYRLQSGNFVETKKLILMK